jgi:hypothetical protein
MHFDARRGSRSKNFSGPKESSPPLEFLGGGSHALDVNG